GTSRKPNDPSAPSAADAWASTRPRRPTSSPPGPHRAVDAASPAGRDRHDRTALPRRLEVLEPARCRPRAVRAAVRHPGAGITHHIFYYGIIRILDYHSDKLRARRTRSPIT